MKRICVIHHTVFSGGGTKSFIDILNMLKHDNEVIACIPSGGEELIHALSMNGIDYYELKMPIPTFSYYSGSSSLFSKSFLKSIYNMKYEQAFVDEISALKPDVIIFNSVVTCVSARKFSSQIKKICFVRETFKKTVWDNVFRNILEKYFNGVCFIAEHEKEYLKLKTPITEVLPDCLSPSTIKFYTKEEACNLENIDPNKFNILFMGGIDYIKGADTILNTMNYLDDDYYLIIGGYFNEELLRLKSILKHWYSPRLVRNRLRIKKYYTRLKNNNRLKCVGFRNDISKIMCACDTVVFPSNRPHQPRPGIEAGEYKKTVIISDFEATKEYFIDNYNAVVFKPYDSKDLAKKIVSLRNDYAKIKLLGENNFLMTQSKHNYLKTKQKLKVFLNNFL